MKTRLFVLILMFMPFLYSCSKDDDTQPRIVGDWYMSTIELVFTDGEMDSIRLDYTEEDSRMFMSFSADGRFTAGDAAGVALSGSYTFDGGELTIASEVDGEAYEVVVFDIVFNNDDQFYMTIPPEMTGVPDSNVIMVMSRM